MKKVSIYTLCFKAARFLLMRQGSSLITRRQPAMDPLHTLGKPPNADHMLHHHPEMSNSPKPHQSNDADTGDQNEKLDDIA